MAYLDVDLMRKNTDLLGRLAACVAEQNNSGVVESGQEYPWVVDHAYTICSAPGWGDKWASGRAAREQEEIPEGEESTFPPIGQDPGVITDGDMLAVIQPMMTP